MSDIMLDHLVNEQIARDLVASMREQPAAENAIGAADLIAYARRDPDQPIDFRLERAIRSDASINKRYRRILQGASLGHSALAMAAGTGTYPERRIGTFDLRVVEDGSDTYVVLSEIVAPPSSPVALEAVGEADSVRIPLSDPVRGHIQIAIDPANEGLSRLLRLLGQPTTELFLL